MARTIVGTRIRERRRQMRVTQSELARRIGISPSYLNLIERNKRGIAGPLLRRAADALSVGLEDLDGAAERRLAELLEEVAHAPSLSTLDIEAASAGELIGRYPGWARAIGALARSERDATATARALADRLTHDPFLGETVHRMLSRISAIRSAAEILHEYPDVSGDQRARFDSIIHEEVRSLSEVGEALAAYFDRIEETDRTLTPLDEVEALFEAHGNHFAELEETARHWSTKLTASDVGDRANEARGLADDNLAAVVESLVESDSHVRTEAGRTKARRALLDYATVAILAPLEKFQELASELRYDAELIAQHHQMSFEAVCRRLAALPPAPETPRFGYVRANAAGTIIEMLGLPGLSVPRYAAACPLWILYRAQQIPATVMRQFALFPSGHRFVFVARARNTGGEGFGQPRHYQTDMLAMTDEDSGRTVYRHDAADNPEEVGAACRICPRRNCPQRVDDPLADQ